MKTSSSWSLIAILLVMAAGCGSDTGQDSLVDSGASSHRSVSDCITCHNSANSPALDPLATNGSGSSGKHITHVQVRAIACERCHNGYTSAPTHMNGTFDINNPLVSVVSISITGPAGSWVKTGPGTGSCSGIACHGAAGSLVTLDWYGTNTWKTPSVCTDCHTSVFSTTLDPTAINGMPPAGRHEKHVLTQAIGCERCHYQYPAQASHANGMLDTADPSVNVVQLDIVVPAGSWVNDSGPQTGQCAAVSCHGTDSLDWYGTSTWTRPEDRTTCHSASYSSALDPIVTNGSGQAGRHGRHVTNAGFSCTRCHLDYPSRTSHASGVLDTQDASVPLVWFDATNRAGKWEHDTGPGTGSCSSLICHGSDSPDWYGTDTWATPSCPICHAPGVSTAVDPVETNGVPPDGRHQKHVTSRGIACERCHNDYLPRPTHMNGTKDTEDPAVDLTQFNIVGAAGSWTGDTGAMTGSCAGISCHGGETLDWYGYSTWTLPASCTSCHAASYAAELDPLVTSGSGSAGKHEKHVMGYGIACTSCHLDYPSRMSHASGAMDAQDPSVPIVWFDPFNSSGTWTNDTGPGPGACSSLYCHGTYSGTFGYYFQGGDGTEVYNEVPYAGAGGTTPGWYTTTGLGCDACHGNPPTIPNSTQKYTWHSGMHANDFFFADGNQCQFCHPDVTGSNGVGTAITDTALHANGSVDVQPLWEAKCFYCH